MVTKCQCPELFFGNWKDWSLSALSSSYKICAGTLHGMKANWTFILALTAARKSFLNVTAPYVQSWKHRLR